jgi:excisionase family DNA binding protein
MRSDLSTDEILTDADVRELLGVSRTTLWRMRQKANLPYGRIGREYRYQKSEILAWLKDHERATAQLPLQLRKAKSRHR